MNYALIENNLAVNVCENPSDCFHPDVAVLFVEVPDAVGIFWIYTPETDTWSAPPDNPNPPITEDRDTLAEYKCDLVDGMVPEKYATLFNYGGNDWQVGPESHLPMLVREQYARASATNDTLYPWVAPYDRWWDVANQNVVFPTVPDFMAFTKEVFAHCEGIKQAAKGHKDNLRDVVLLPDYDAVNNYDIEAGW